MQLNFGLTTIIFLLNLLLSAVYILSFTYYFQIKEYRFDRFFSFLREKGLLGVLIPDRLYRPRPSFRNLTITGLSFFAVFTLLLMAQAPWAVLLSFFNVILGVLITEPLALFKRSIDISKAKKNLAKSKTQIIGITGSYGKTSTKEFLYQILKIRFNTEKTLQNFNTNVGVAMSINQNLKPETQFFIAEIGAYKRGEIAEVTKWTGPQYGILTALGNQHIDLFGSKENLIGAKRELLESLPENGIAYINVDVEGHEKAIEGLKCGVIKYSGIASNADVYLTDLQIKNGVTMALVNYRNEKFNLRTKLIGSHYITNLLPCIALAYDLGVSREEIEKAIGNLGNEFGKLSLHAGLNSSQILYDGKNSSVAGFIAAVKTLNSLAPHTKLVITKGIIELGKEKRNSYEKILRTLHEANIKMITTDKLFRDLNIHPSAALNVKIVKTEKEIYEFLKHQLDNNSALLIEGKFTEPFVHSLGINNERSK